MGSVLYILSIILLLGLENMVEGSLSVAHDASLGLKPDQLAINVVITWALCFQYISQMYSIVTIWAHVLLLRGVT